jgi:FMN phosphatase YigB (HAD superfamily)
LYICYAGGMIKAIVFDCYGVLVGHSFWDTYAEAGGDIEKDEEFIHEMLARANSALMSNEEFAHTIAGRIGIPVKKWLEVTSRMERPNEALFKYIAGELKPNYKIGLLSNANAGSVERRLPAEKRALLDAFVVSGEVGHMKPEREIYQKVADDLGVEFGEMVFTDDLQPYVDAAAGYGIHAIRYRDLASFKKQLKRALTAQENS